MAKALLLYCLILFSSLNCFADSGTAADLKSDSLNEEYLDLQRQLAEKPNNSKTLHNLSFVEKDLNQLGWAMAHIEKGLFHAPLNFESNKLKKALINTIIEKRGEPPREQIDWFTRLLDYIPGSLLSITLGGLLFLFLLNAARTYRKSFIDISDYKKDKNLMMKSLYISLALLPLYFLKLQSIQEPWICITSPQANIVSGPGENHRLVGKLEEGDCLKALNSSKKWIALATKDQKYGWISAADILQVRGKNLGSKK